ncbi:MAG: hypothetical protein Q9160_002789 [Pyrenula sp. 1 TL-2023]
MSMSDEALKAKLSTLNETQDSIVSVSQWVMFHRRHANQIVQNSRARRKDDFPNAFSPIIAEAAQVAYKDGTTEIQQKIRRVIEVWRARQVFDPSVQEAIESRVDEIDRNRSANRRPLMGGSLFSSGAPGSLPTEIQPLAPLQIALSKASLSSKSALSTAETDYTKLHDPNMTLPSPPVHAARLSALLKSLANAESSLAETIKSRSTLIDSLAKILDDNRAALAKEQSEHATIRERQSATDAKKREVEDGIMRAYSADNISPTSDNASPFAGDNAGRRSSSLDMRGGADSVDPERPEVEALTPPPPRSPLTPPLAPVPDATTDSFVEATTAAATIPDPEPTEDADVSNLLASMTNANAPPPLSSSTPIPAVAGGSDGSADFTTAFIADPRITARANGTTASPATKKRKVSQLAVGADEMDSVPGLGFSGGNAAGGTADGAEVDVMADLDDDVAELLRQESRKAAV